MTSEIVTSAGALEPPDSGEPIDPHLPYDCRELSEAEISSLVQEIDRDGYAVLPRYISPAELVALRQFVRDTVAAAGNRYTMLRGPEPVAETALGKLASSPALRHICMRAYEIATSRPAPDQPYYQILRCLTGSTGRKHSMVFHFDSYLLTVLLPIEVPTGKDNGELIVLPNFRRVRRWYASNLVDKILLDNPLTQWALRSMAKSIPDRFLRISMVPGNLYFFWGYRSIHTNAPCDPEKIRATALFHYADPHRGSGLRAWLGR
ncbi:hypothetical protein G6L94_13750 [Agrobacterium rhizogenes]|uniref:hypothetical protein n=1 Tax=Rhizobium rhizogenes TaxID=359 RepID=UPI0009DD9E37|nr:hypothetical protein [Rhizobium rhizogenes]NTF81935.1 hypothetical protein [Rhizobium rhizogenes]NTH77952.1 hypothetical protein [Rhizobium rhizogenes]NTH83960.1 hypothetical protein [Rhizobium rhizogenes]NTI23079.1 hypothetical protein [Rhizobium rhizogenes]NTI49380.1 hypothetical protein [Rhizobium rhizogenes]